jgi:hypothetical protein
MSFFFLFFPTKSPTKTKLLQEQQQQQIPSSFSSYLAP